MISPTIYPIVFVFFLLAWPWLCADSVPVWQTVLLMTANCGLFALVAQRTSSNRIGFWSGLTHASVKLRTGCANITIVLALIACTILYVLAIVYVAIGFFKGKAWTERMWTKSVE